MIKTRILEPKYTPRDAIVLLLHTDPKIQIEDIEDVFYPYVRMRWQLTVGKGKFIKQLIKYVDCIIDLVEGTAYDTVYDKDAGGRPVFRDVEFDEEDAMAPNLTDEDYHQKGHDYALKQYIGRAKLTFVPKMEIIEEEKFYKHFYIVTCRDRKGRIYFVMVDAVDGGISILDHEAHIDELAKLGEAEELALLAGVEYESLEIAKAQLEIEEGEEPEDEEEELEIEDDLDEEDGLEDEDDFEDEEEA